MKKLLFLAALFLSACNHPVIAAPPTTGQILFQQKTSGPFNQFGVTPITNQTFGWDGTKVVMLPPSGGISWGGITGTLSDQTDLQTALNLLQAKSGTLALAGFGSITGTVPTANLPGTVQYTNGTLALGSFGSITGTLADARLSANVQLKNGTLALGSFGSITGVIGTTNLPATIPSDNLPATVQYTDGVLALNSFSSVTGTLAAARIADLSGTYLAVGTAAASYQPLDGDLTALAALSGTNNIYYRSAANTWTSVTVGTGLSFSGGTLSNSVTGTVTSIALTAPAIFGVAGSPVTTTGTLALSLATQTANRVWSGPNTGSAATPTFRALVAADLPDVSSTYLTVATAASSYQPLDADLTALAALGGTNNMYYRSAANTWTTVAIGTGISFSGGTLSSTSSGSVSSVALALPNIFTVSGSPVISSGTLTGALATQATKTVFIGPVSGSAAAPTFRLLVAGDLPDISSTYLTVAAAASGYQPLDADLTALAALSGTNNIYYRSAANTWSSVTIGSGLAFSAGSLTATNDAAVTSVALALPNIFTVSGSPVTTSGTLTGTLATQVANKVFAGPTTGSDATPTFRSLVSADIPSLSGTYLTPAAGDLAYQPLDGDLTALAALSGTHNIYYRSAANTWSSVTVGTGLSFSGATLSNTVTGTVTSVALTLPAMFSVSGSPVTTTGTLAATLATQAANSFLGGPTTGIDAAPTFRTLVVGDFPDLSGIYQVAGNYQPLDGDLTALAALAGTNNIYYRSAANTWTSVTVGGNLSFSAGTLNANAGLVANTFTGAQVMSVAGVASTPAVKVSGAWFTGGSSTTTKPQLLVEASGATSTNWLTAGTGIGVNAASGFAGNLIDLKINGGTTRFNVQSNGNGGLSGALFSVGLVDSGDLTVTGLTALQGGTNITGTVAADDAAAGIVGEFVSSSVVVISAIALTTGTSANITSISLTAGDWDVEGSINFNATAATITATRAAINTSSLTIPADGSEVYSGNRTTTTTSVDAITLPRKRVNATGATTVYLIGNCTFSAGTVGGSGTINARRVR